jgi:UDP-N-acetylglucosamine diphosphorylase/glucosamine-1-phosphate N-acetyltransferase
MKNIILFDNDTRDYLLPFTFTKPACELRVGIMTIREKWELWLQGIASFITVDYLSEKFDITISEKNYLINGTLLPSNGLCQEILKMEEGEAMLKEGELLAAVLNKDQFERLMTDNIEELTSYEIEDIKIDKINNIWDIFKLNEHEIIKDFTLITSGRKSSLLSKTNQTICPENIFVEQGASIECATFNAKEGPVYIGKDVTVMEGALIRGPIAICDNAIIKMGAKIYGGTTIGPGSIAGGEIKNVVFLGNSNKSHDGYLGNSVIGEWCNLGADTSSSNLKNNWGEIKIWNYLKGDFVPSGEQKAGLFLGDFSMTGINTMFNTGTVIGLCCNIFGSEMPPRFIPSFSWGSSAKFVTHKPDKAFGTIEKMMKSKGKFFSTEDRLILLKIFEETARFRTWDKITKSHEKKFYNQFE